jgi:hypothetical protein
MTDKTNLISELQIKKRRGSFAPAFFFCIFLCKIPPNGVSKPKGGKLIFLLGKILQNCPKSIFNKWRQ